MTDDYKREMTDRVKDQVNQWIEELKGKTVVVATHGAVFGIQADDGTILWRRHIGFESTIPPTPETHGMCHPRHVTAAWLVIPPVLVKMPAALCMPSTSSGLVSFRTRMTFSPASVLSTASLADGTV